MKKNFEIVLKEYMWLYNISQIELSKITKIPLPTIKKYLSGSLIPREKNLKKICENLDFSEIVLTNFDLSNYQGIQNALLYIEDNYNDFSENAFDILEKLEKEKRPKDIEEVEATEEILIEMNLLQVFKAYRYIFLEEKENVYYFKNLRNNKIIEITDINDFKNNILNFIDFLFYVNEKKD